MESSLAIEYPNRAQSHLSSKSRISGRSRAGAVSCARVQYQMEEEEDTVLHFEYMSI